MAKFFLTNGAEISIDQFIKTYNYGYFQGNPRQVPRVIQNSRIAEETIERILKNGIKEPVDIYKILAWKVGKIRHAASDDANRIIYAANWINAENGLVKNYRYHLDMRMFAEHIIANIDNLERLSVTNPQAVLNWLRNGDIPAPKGIGTVYLITLLYFISRGRWPIYDRFAMMALVAISDEKKPGESVSFLDLPDKYSDEYDDVMDICNRTYISKLTSIIGENYNQNRDIDRALWVYGHLFNRAKN